MTNGPARLAAVLMLLAAFGVACAGSARAQESAPESAPIVVPEAYLDPLKSLDGDEAAFMDQLWAMGDAEFDRLAQLERQLARMDLPPAEMAALEREFRLSVLKLKNLADYGVARYSNNTPCA